MRERAIAAALAAALSVALAACSHASARSSATPYELGRAADPASVVAADIDVAPDGAGLPHGSGDAAAGAALFARSCQSCHGVAIRLDPGQWPYATTLFDYIRRAMPPNRKQTLPADDVYSLTAYELFMNRILPADERLTKTTLPRIAMPDADRFIKQP